MQAAPPGGRKEDEVIQGYIHPDFWRVAKVLQGQIPAATDGGAAVCVYHGGEKVVDVWAGTRDASGTRWTEDTLALSFSATKGVTATVLHRLVDRGLLDYDDPVAEYWPEFAQNRKQRVTIRQLLCHESGLYPIRSIIDNADRMRDWGYMTEALARSAPAFEPGTANGYQALTFGWLIGEIAQRVTRKPFSEVLESEIAAPLRLDGLYVGVPAEQLHRAASLIRARWRPNPERLRPVGRVVRGLCRGLRIPYDPGRTAEALMPIGIESFDWTAHDTLRVSIPGANGTFTARSLARMYAALAGGGQIDGVRLLSEETLARATEVQNRRVDRVVVIPMHWRLGYHRAFAGLARMPRGFGHFGFGGSGAFADPDRNLAVAMVLNSGVGTPFGDTRIARIGQAAARCADRR